MKRKRKDALLKQGKISTDKNQLSNYNQRDKYFSGN